MTSGHFVQIGNGVMINMPELPFWMIMYWGSWWQPVLKIGQFLGRKKPWLAKNVPLQKLSCTPNVAVYSMVKNLFLVVYSLHMGTLFGSFISGATLFSNIIDHELIFYRVYSQNRCQKVFNRGAW